MNLFQTWIWIRKIVFLLLFPALCSAETSVRGEARPILSLVSKAGVENSTIEISFTLAMLDALPQHHLKTATPWYNEARTFSGPLARDVVNELGVKGKIVYATALNDYTIGIPLEDFEKYDVVFATRINGKVLSVRDKGPVFIIYPFQSHPKLKTEVYYHRCIWQLARIEIRP